MSSFLGLTVGLMVLGFLAFRAVHIWIDVRWRGQGLWRRLGWTFLGALVPSHYWWGARIALLSPSESRDLLARETARLGIDRADDLLCPLCGAQVLHAWSLDTKGRPAVAPGPIQCPSCDFRLDACRHCTHFLPGKPRTWGGLGGDSNDLTFGRCGYYRVSQPVEQVAQPEIARQLKDRGFEHVRAPLPITDSFVPPDFCTAFNPDKKRVRASQVRWPDARRAALLHLLALSPIPDAKPSAERSSP